MRARDFEKKPTRADGQAEKNNDWKKIAVDDFSFFFSVGRKKYQLTIFDDFSLFDLLPLEKRKLISTKFEIRAKLKKNVRLYYYRYKYYTHISVHIVCPGSTQYKLLVVKSNVKLLTWS